MATLQYAKAYFQNCWLPLESIAKYRAAAAAIGTPILIVSHVSSGMPANL